MGFYTYTLPKNVFGKSVGSKDLQKHKHNSLGFAGKTLSLNSGGFGYQLSWVNGGNNGDAASFSTGEVGTGNGGNIQPTTSTNYIIKL